MSVLLTTKLFLMTHAFADVCFTLGKYNSSARLCPAARPQLEGQG